MSRELDAKIAEKIMGWGDVKPYWFDGYPMGFDPSRKPPDQHSEVPHYSTDIAVAWDVVNNLAEKGFLPSVHLWDGKWIAEFYTLEQVDDGRDTYAYAEAGSVTEAICRAALKAKHHTRGEDTK
mgnify:CR=1 FL=1